eukprot:222397-Prymnesium_polylepis.1
MYISIRRRESSRDGHPDGKTFWHLGVPKDRRSDGEVICKADDVIVTFGSASLREQQSAVPTAAFRKKWSRQVSTLARCRCVGFSHVIGCRELPELVNAG